MHWHDFLELEYVSSGDGVHYLNQQIVPFSAGSLHLLLPTDFHEIHVNPNDYPYVFSVKFPETLLDRDMFNMIFQNNTVRQVVPAGRAAPVRTAGFYRPGLGIQARRTAPRQGDERPFAADTHQAGAPGAGTDAAGPGGSAADGIGKRGDPGDGLHPQEFCPRADAQGYLPVRAPVAQLFEQHLPPDGWAAPSANIRAMCACAMPLFFCSIRTKPSCKFAEEVGYNSYEHFERIFRRQFGVSPKEFRKRVLTNHSAFKGEDDCLPLSGYWRYEHGKDQT